jgi:hypothetical protein
MHLPSLQIQAPTNWLKTKFYKPFQSLTFWMILWISSVFTFDKALLLGGK